MSEEPALGHFKPATCCSGCGVLWEKWCRGCNLVYCTSHHEPKAHKCRSLPVEQPAADTPAPPKPPPAPVPLVVPIPPRKRKKQKPEPPPQAELPLSDPE